MKTQRTERLNCLSCVTQLVMGGARVQAGPSGSRLPLSHSAMCPLWADVVYFYPVTPDLPLGVPSEVAWHQGEAFWDQHLSHRSSRLILSTSCSTIDGRGSWEPGQDRGQGPGLWVRLRFQSQYCHLKAMWPWASYLTFQSLSFFICEIGITDNAYTSWGFCGVPMKK